MNYVITESRLYELIDNYIDKILDSPNKTYRHDHFILVDDPWTLEDPEVVIEYDYTDGRLWISSKVLNLFDSLFGLSPSDAAERISERFEKKHGVDIKRLYPWQV